MSNIRPIADPIGFAHSAQQLETVMQRIARDQPFDAVATTVNALRLAIAPHDDYAFVGRLYPELLQGVTADTVILFGVAHKARDLRLEDELIFDSFDSWHGPYGDVAVSPLREDIIERLPTVVYHVNDRMQTIEHSVEAIVPFLQHYNRGVRIVSILVPYMSLDRMEQLAAPLADAIGSVMNERELEWGRDVAMVISTDAVHYGDEDWGGRDFARYGADSEGYRLAVDHEHRVIDDCLTGALTRERIRRFTEYTLSGEDHREYKWTWCGRYSVPFGLLTALELQQRLGAAPLVGTLVGYGTSIDERGHIDVADLGMGVTAPANIRHWVGYASVAFP